MATMTSNRELRELMGAYGTTLAGQTLDAWSQMVNDARTFDELLRLSRTYLPPLWKRTADQVGVISSDIYLEQRNALLRSAGSFDTVSPLMGTKISKTINAVTVGLTEARRRKLDVDFAKIAEMLTKEAQQLPYDKLKSSMMSNGLIDASVESMELQVSSKACAFCCLVASGSSGTRRVSTRSSTNNRDSDRAADRRLTRNLDLFSEGLQQEYQAHIHLSCNCIYRPVYIGGTSYIDEDSDKRLTDFQESYYRVLDESGLSSMDIRGKGGVLSQIRKIDTLE